MPRFEKKFVKDWIKLMPDYKFMRWDESNFDVNSIPFTKEAYSMGKLAFVADYVRLYALYNYGGIYLDTDVKVVKRFDKYLNHSFFSSVEFHPIDNIDQYIDEEGNRIGDFDNVGIAIHSAIIASEPKTNFIKDCLNYYQGRSFVFNVKENKTIPIVLAINAEKRGFKYKDQLQKLRENIIIFPSKVFAEYRTYNKESVAIHFCEGSWLESTFKLRFQNGIKKNPFLFYLYSKIYKKLKTLFSL